VVLVYASVTDPKSRPRQIFRPRTLLWCLTLAAATLALFLPALDDGFVFDDRRYILENTLLQQGFTRQGLYFSFFGAYESNWHPVTWLSHTADIALFGLNPAPHHAVNILLHAANAALLAGLMCRWTGALWASLLAAALFALHPLRVESVAWISERKDLLCGFFWLLAMHAHCGLARRPGLRRSVLLAATVALALLSKPMAVTLPLALLLADFWPLGRLRFHPRTAILEKVPLLTLSLLTGLMTLNAQRSGGALRSFEAYPLPGRFANALISLGLYLKKAFLPLDLAVFYPYRRHEPGEPQVLLAAAVILAVSACSLALRRRAPWLAMGWCWYLITVAPVLGLVQVGDQALADRYTYLPLIGVSIALVWGGATWWARSPRARPALGAAAAVAVLVCAALTFRELAYWDNPEKLFRRAMAVSPGNWKAQMLLGLTLEDQGRAAEAEAHYRAALAVNPRSPEARFNLGALLFEQGRAEEALPHLRESLATNPVDPVAREYYESALSRFIRDRESAAGGAPARRGASR
jgi:tetratricopeptide (TPR) repeat protein